MPNSKWWVYTAAGQIWGRDEEKRNCSGENNGGRKLGFTWRTETLGKARSPHSSRSEREFTHLPGTGVILSVLHWGKLLMLPSCFGRNFLPKFSGFCLLGKQLRACACLVDAASLSFTDVLHATPFFFLSLCADTFCLCCSSSRAKNSRVGLIILLPWWPGWLFCPCAHGKMLQTFTSVQTRRIVICIFLFITQGHLNAVAGTAAQCSYLLSTRFSESTREPGSAWISFVYQMESQISVWINVS